MGGKSSPLPHEYSVSTGQLVIHSDFRLSDQHRLVRDLVIRRQDLSNLLGITAANEPIHVFLFDSESGFRNYVNNRYPDLPNRRALFVKNDTELNVYAFWGPRVGEDLRHEVTHGYLHSVVPDIPIWLDEGIAEYFEVPRGKRGVNAAHVYRLANQWDKQQWRPNLRRVEAITDDDGLTQMDYAESWLWVHFLLTDETATQQPMIQAFLQNLQANRPGFSISEAVEQALPDASEMVISHLETLRDGEQLAPPTTWQ